MSEEFKPKSQAFARLRHKYKPHHEAREAAFKALESEVLELAAHEGLILEEVDGHRTITARSKVARVFLMAHGDAVGVHALQPANGFAMSNATVKYSAAHGQFVSMDPQTTAAEAVAEDIETAVNHLMRGELVPDAASVLATMSVGNGDPLSK